ncbi:RecX family transcriptional regulator [Catenisphaera adipataccumulans]|jgi:1,2-diacylglycerol 3-alpha-glucosyltransferase|uniref:Regulatory protein RecX n=1 Tax=Catenisphaera adipataccumulans TaxID=700500 RepID=A0A7W8CXH3_9FIRM|nr:RecX family transcriptional regulator [Catenisphaera adipataccumulans]MBB5183432.1 1,2-diacylglycerol 3-alpha-glucosyltransferase [Catenisphaera adipataccumulans]
MRIGMFSDAYLPDINGVVSSIATLKAALEKLGHTVFVISNHKGVAAEYDEENHILRLPGIEWKKMYGYKMSSPIQIAGEEYVRKMDLDVIHVHTEVGIGVFARQTAKKLHIPVVYTYHTLYEDYMHYVNPRHIPTIDKYGKKAIRFFSRQAGNGPQAVIAPSNKTKKALERYGVITPIYIVPTGIDLSEFKRENLDADRIRATRAACGMREEDHVVVFVGRIAKEKCIEMPIESLKYTQDRSIKLVIVGGGTDMKFYQDLVKSYGLEDRIHFTGRIDKQDIAYYYSAFDAFVSASLSETQGMTYLEALASEVPVFGRRDEVLDGLVEEDVTGYYFDDAHELAEKFDRFFAKSEAEREAMRPACLEKTKPYDTELFANKVLAVYKQAIDDYNMAYIVDKMHFLDDFVQLTVRRKRSNAEPMNILVPEEDVYAMKISVNTMLDSYYIENYLAMQEFYKAFRIEKRRVAAQDYTCYEIKRHCMMYLNLEEDLADAIVATLSERNLLDDRRYAENKAEVWQAYGMSKKKIRMRLRKKGVPEEYIDLAVDTLPDDIEEENARNMAKSLVRTIHAQSQRNGRQSLIRKLVNKGYTYDIAKKAGESVTLDLDEKEALQEAIEKAKRLYASYEDESKRLQKIRLYCMRKGFTSSQIEEELESEATND